MAGKLKPIDRRRARIRRRLTARNNGRPRLSVFRSHKNIYAQVIDDDAGRTLAAASSQEKKLRKKTLSVDTAAEVGKLVAARADDAGVKAVVFDRGGFPFHGRVKALADAAREGGLEF